MNEMAYPSFHDFGADSLEVLLELKEPPLAIGKDPFRQLRYIQEYVQRLKCHSFVVESGYIDRDYIEDHSIFYSRNREPLPNCCTRIHFFRELTAKNLQSHLDELAEGAAKNKEAGPSMFREFSDLYYLGFMVVKPLHGCPVGRTVLRTFPHRADDGSVREFRGSLRYEVHILGVCLSVLGLAFQQQDEGVSACATTAIWSSLQKLKSTEEVSAVTPAQITTLASRFSMPFGRSMPSEGLSLDQMCQSIHALAISPDLLRTPTYEVARGIIYAASLSHTTPILIIAHNKKGRHAVTVAGVKRAPEHTTTTRLGLYLDDRAGDLLGLYIHDDRIGPYVKAGLHPLSPQLKKVWAKYPDISQEAAQLTIFVNGKKEEWLVTHVLTPIHAKVRLSFNQIRLIAYDAARMLNAAIILKGMIPKRIGFGVRILRAHIYIQKMLSDSNASPTRRKSFFESISLSRYVGLIRLQTPTIGPFDFLVDTTGTPRNARCLGIVYRGTPDANCEEIGDALAKHYDCAFVS